MKMQDKRKKSAPSARLRTVALGSALLAVCIIALVLRITSLQSQWLSHQSLDTLQQLAARPGADAATCLAFGEKLAAVGQPQEALAQFQRAQQALAPNQHDAVAQRIHARLGFTLAQLGDDENAVPYLDQARRMGDDDAITFLGYGTIFSHRNMVHFAITQFKLAAAMEPQSYETHYLLGKAYNDNAEPQAAVEELRKAIALNSDYAPAHAELGHAYAFQAQFPPAVEQFRIALKQAPEHREYLHALGAALGMSARSHDQYQEAAALLVKTLQEDPNNEMLVFTLGQLHLRFQNIDEAHRYLKHAIELRPGHAEAWYNLARVEQLLGDQKQADVANRTFQKLNALHDDAIIAEKKVAANLKDPAARLELARSYHAAGNIMGAYWQLKTALKLNPEFADAQKEMTRTEQEYQAAMQQRPAGQIKRDGSETFGPPPPAELMSPEAGLISTGKR